MIFNKSLDKLLFIIYHNPRDRIVRKLDFPKGKIDQNEEPIECAAREIYEEASLELKDDIDEDRFVKVETIRNRVVTLYFVEGVDPEKA